MSDIFLGLESDDLSAPSAESNIPFEPRGQLSAADDAKRYMTAGNATVTLQSKKTGARFTYKLRAAEDGDCFFVGLLSGPDNTADYRYLGRISRGIFWLGRKVPKPNDVSRDAPSARAFDWTWRQLARGVLPEALEIFHEGTCGRCGRKLTVPESIKSGLGPDCREKFFVG